MKMTKKIMSLLLALSMLLCLLSGCGGTKPAASAETAEAVSEAVSETAPAEEVAPEASSVEELTSEEASVVEEIPEEPQEAAIPGQIAVEAIKAGDIDRTVELPLTTNGETLSYWITTNFGAASGISSYNDHYGMAHAQEITGVNLEFRECSMAAASEQFSLMVASNDLADIIVQFDTMYTPGIDNAVEEDLIIDLQDYLDFAPIFQQLVETDPQWLEELQSEGGVLGSFKTLYTSFAWVKESIALRGDWLNELGLEKPVTYSEYHDVFAAFKSEYDPTYTFNLGPNLASAWFQGGYGINVTSTGASNTGNFYVDGSTVHDGYTSDRFRDYLTMLNQWYNEDLISADYVTIGALEFFENDYTALITTGEFGAVNGAGGLLPGYASYTDDPDFEFVAGYMPRNDEDPTLCYLAPSTLTNSDYSASIATSCDDISLAMAFLDYFYSEEGSLLASFGLEGVSWERGENGEPVLTELISSSPDTNGALMSYKVNIGSIADPNQSFRVTATETAINTMQFWTDDQSELFAQGNNAYYPSDVSLTADEQEEVSAKLADIATYVSEAVPGFILGTKGMDEFDDYCVALEDMGIRDVVAIYQAAYDRYIG